MAKTYQVEKDINGVHYVAQFNGVAAAMDALEEWRKDNPNINLVSMANYVLEHVIVEPKGLTMDDFESVDDLNEVIAFGRAVCQGEFRDQANNGAAKKKG